MKSKKDSVKEAIAHREVFPVPYFFSFHPLLANRLRKHFCTDDLLRCLGDYIFFTAVVPTIPVGLVKGSYTDIFGVGWEGVGDTRGQVKEHPLKKPSLEGYSFPEPCPPKTLQRIREEIEPFRDLYVLVKIGDLFERAHFMRGMPELLVDMYRNPAFVDDLFRGITEYNLGVIDRLASLDIDGLWLSDDYGSQTGLLMSPRLWRRFIKPHLQEIIQRIHREGFHFFLHSDGAIGELIPEMIEVGVDVIHPLQSECMDVMEIKRRYGDKFTIWGGIGSQSTLYTETPEGIRKHVRSLCKRLGRGGGFILCPGIQIMHNVPFENVLAFIDAAMNQEGR
jgi:uroporphyrinogen decarboxylase